MDTHVMIGVVAAICAIPAYSTYVVGIYTRGVKPQRASWAIWAAACTLLFLALLAKGERTMVWIPLIYALGSTVIFIISWRRGVGGWTKLDKICIALAAASLVAWGWTKEPLLAVILNIVVDGLGAIPTVVKAYRDPVSERNPGWWWFSIANTANLFAIKTWTIANASFTIYMFLACLLILLLAYRPAHKPRVSF